MSSTDVAITAPWLGRPPEAVHALQRVEASVMRAEFAAPSFVATQEIDRFRYLLGFARLYQFEPGAAARGGKGDRPDVDVDSTVRGLRGAVAAATRGLQDIQDPKRKLLEAAKIAHSFTQPLAATRSTLARRDGLTVQDIDAEAGRRVLVNVAGGGGGSGYVYIGAYERLEQAAICPEYVIGASIGALLGIFRARKRRADWDQYVNLAKSLDRRELFSLGGPARKHGLPSLLGLRLTGAIDQAFRNADGSPMRISDLDVPYEAVVAGIKRVAFDRLPSRYKTTQATADAKPSTRFSPLVLAQPIAQRMWEVAAFVDPRIVRPVVFGATPETEDFDAVDAAGFSAAIPGVLHYEVEQDDTRMQTALDALFGREDLAALVDGGAVSNVPAELAWRRVHAGKLGTRNAFYLAFDCFHPQWDPAHLWLQPITQAIALQMARNRPFADWIVRFEPTLSPVNLVPAPAKLDQAIGWGREQIERVLPLIERSLAPVGFPGA